ncbi:MAG: NAD(P)-dependent oxidoreductase, partial [Chloroflexota bacterium]
MKRIGFVGLGTMGRPMAANILKHGFEVYGFDVNPTAVASLAPQGLKACASPAEVARNAEAVVTMLPTEAEVGEVCFGPDGLMEGAQPGLLVVDMSTISPDASQKIAAQVAAKGCEMIDAPVGRSSKNAEEGTLLIMVGGAEAQLERARPILNCLGDTIVHCGSQGQGLAAKLVNNFLSLGSLAVVAEAFALGRQAGVSLETMLQIANMSAAGNNYFKGYLQQKALGGDLAPGFKIDLAHKDLGLVVNWANRMQLPLPVGALVRERYSEARLQGRGGQDCTAIVHL